MNPERLRQIAILVDSLDVDRADRLLEQLPEQTQRQVRDAVMDLDYVDEKERQKIIADFVGRGQKPSRPAPNQSAIAPTAHDRTNNPSRLPNASPAAIGAGTYGDPRRTYGSIATEPEIGFHTEQASSPTDFDAAQFRPMAPPKYDNFASLPTSNSYTHTGTSTQSDTQHNSSGAVESDHDLVDALTSADIDTLASVVMKESPQVLAVVLSLLPAEKSALLLELFPAIQQQEALRRLGQLDEIDEDVLDYLQQQLNLVIRRRIKLKRNQRTGPGALSGILSAAKRLQAKQVVQSIEREIMGEDASQIHVPDQASSQVSDFAPRPTASNQRPVVTPKSGAVNAYAAHAQLPAQHTTGLVNQPKNPQFHSKATTKLDPLNAQASRKIDGHLEDMELNHQNDNRLDSVKTTSTAKREDRFVSNEIDSVDAFLDADVRMTFQQFYDCDRTSLQTVLATAKPKLTLLALKGAAPKLLNRILKMLPIAEAKEVEYRIQNLGPTRLQDIQEAQQYLLRIASVLQDMGQFQLPRKRMGIL